MEFSNNDFEKTLYNQVSHYSQNNRDESANFLAWFLINYFRVDEDYAFDLICDHKNDKGIDGIFVDEETEEIFIFQSKFRKKFDKTEGDSDLRKLVGTGEWVTIENLAALDNSFASKELKSLMKREKIFDFINRGYKKKLFFVTTGYFNKQAQEYIEIVKDQIECWDCNKLFENYTYCGKDDLVHSNFKIFPEGKVIEYNHEKDHDTLLITIKGKSLLKLDGIVDRRLFAKNVRYGLGRTKVNKEITKTVLDKKQHKRFLLYHNGITIIAEKVEYSEINNIVEIENYSIVNGCQSTLTLYENRESLTDDLLLELKIIETGADTYLADKITYYANNQNPINVADLKSREKFQFDLQKKINSKYGDELFYQISRGEIIKLNVRIIDKILAAQLLYSFKNGKPYDAHRKTKLFSQNYNDIFTRNVDENLIYFLERIFQLIISNIEYVEELGVRNYMPTRFFILYVIKLIMQKDNIGKLFFDNHDGFLKKYSSTINDAFSKLIKMIIIHFNHRIINFKDEDNFIDYKTILINGTSSRKLSEDIITNYEVLLVHDEKNKLSSLLTI